MTTIVVSPISTDGTPYTLSDAAAALRLTPLVAIPMGREPLLGTYDGTNLIFRTPAAPLAASAGLTVEDEVGAAVNVASVDYTNGKVVLATAPSSVVYANFTVQVVSDAMLTEACRRGFLEMESRYQRGYVLVDGAISDSTDTVSDPACGTLTFATSPVQVAFFLACCELRLLFMLQSQAANTSIAYREQRVGGLDVDGTRRARDLKDAIARLETDLEQREEAARFENGDTEFGDFLAGPTLVRGVWSE